MTIEGGGSRADKPLLRGGKVRPTHAETKLRMPQALMAELREQYAQSYAQHRLSMNAWLVRLLLQALSAKNPEHEKGKRA